VALRVTETNKAGHLLFEVLDTGPGIAKEELATVFEAFVQSRVGRDQREGTGLGLTISANYVKLMGGDLRLESEVGRGANTHFEIPVRIADGEPVPEVSRPRAVVSADRTDYRILVADDGWVMRHLIRRLLEPLGFEVREASDGGEAVAIWKQWHPHLIWMDLRMPVMDGFEATRRIKAEPGGISTVIVAVTASTFENPRAAAREAGCDGFLPKPFDEAALFDFLHEHLGVRFVYAEADIAKVTGTVGLAAVAAVLVSLPVPLRAKLRNALAQLDVATVQAVLDEIGRRDSDGADTLRALTANYQYGDLLRLIEDLDSKIPS
jgi:CheY-like chemotaxis protein